MLSLSDSLLILVSVSIKAAIEGFAGVFGESKSASGAGGFGGVCFGRVGLGCLAGVDVGVEVLGDEAVGSGAGFGVAGTPP